MQPRQLIDTALVPGGVELRLFRRGNDHMIVLDRNELMNSRMSGSEQALAVMTCARLAQVAAPQLLIGGYGMGFTLRAALDCVAPDAAIYVAELVPQIIDWARGPMAALTGNCLDDQRVRVVIDDVSAVIRDSVGRFDAIMLDVDNGPDGLVRPQNGALYSIEGLKWAKAALRPRGVLAIWSAAPDAAFTRRLHSIGFATVETVTVRERSNGKGAKHVIWLATAP